MILPYPQWRNIFPSESVPSLQELAAIIGQFNCDDVLQSLSKINVICSRIHRGGDNIPVEIFKLHFEPDAFEHIRKARIERNAVFPYRPAVIFLEKLVLMNARKEGGETVASKPILFGRMLVAASEYAEGAKLSAVQHDDADEEAKKKRREILAGTFYRQLLFNSQDYIANLMGRYWAMLILYPEELKPLYPNEFFDLNKFFEDETCLGLEIYVMLAFALYGHYAPAGPGRPLDVLKSPFVFPVGETHFDSIRPEHHESARRFLAIFSRTMEEFRPSILKEIPSPDAGGYDARFIFETPLYKSGKIYFPLDLDLVMQQATSGLYWKAHGILRKTRRGEYDRFKTWWGRLFEWHIKKVLEAYLPAKDSPDQRLFVEREDGFEGADFVIHDGEALIVIEVTTSGVPVMKVVSGASKDIFDSLSKILIETEDGDAGKAAQLGNFIEGFKAGRIRIGKIDPKTIKHIFPVILSEQGIPQLPPFIGTLREDISKRTRLGELSGWLEFWDAEDIEKMGGVIEQGLAAFIASKYLNGMGDSTMQNYLHATNAAIPSTVIGSNFAQFGARAQSTFFKKTLEGTMKVLIFGATGMVGQSVLRECLLSSEIESVVTIGRQQTGQPHEKLGEIVHADLFNLEDIKGRLQGFDACFFCLGVSSAGMSEADYRRVTFDLTLSVARTLSRLNPGMTFIYVSGMGTDSTEKGRSMWARVKGETENALQRLPFKASYMFRLGALQPLYGIRSKTPVYNILYAVLGPLLTPLRAIFPNFVTTSEQLGRAMIVVAKRGVSKAVLEVADINSNGKAAI